MSYKTKLSSRDVTPKTLWDRRKTLKLAPWVLFQGLFFLPKLTEARDTVGKKLKSLKDKLFSTTEPLTAYSKATSYNNYYEFGTDKSDPKKYAYQLEIEPWVVRVEGHVSQPKDFTMNELLTLAPMEERVYRLRCVEGWSMVIPWIGYSLSELLRRVAPTKDARYVEFTTVYRPDQMPGQRKPILDWPYTEGLRLDEAMNPLTLLSFGMYGSFSPNQNGAPVRVIVPWKYGFKSAKSIVSIRLTEKEPQTTWVKASPKEYGFYSNVNPSVNHPRWSQARERRIGEFRKRDTLLFNGYGDQVAKLYEGMNLEKYF